MSPTPRFLYFSTSQQVLFARRLSLYLHSGIPIARALSFIMSDAPSHSARCILMRIEETVAAGFPLSHGLEQFPKQFKPFAIGFVRAGEASGTLSETLSRLAVVLAKRDALRRKIMSALTYPAIIGVGTIAITLFLVLCIFPKIIPVLRGFHTTLPFTTRALIKINDLCAHQWPLILGLLVCSITLSIIGFRFKRVRLAAEQLLLRVPVAATLYQHYAIATSCRSLSLQLKGGVRILSTLELMQTSLPGTLYPEAIRDVAHQVAQGHRLSDALRRHTTLFPSLVSQMVSAGEATGTLSANLETLAEVYEESLDEFTKNLTVLIEPVLMVMMGFIVGFVALAIITPIYAVTQNLSLK